MLKWEREHVWHPFTPMKEWTGPDFEPLFLVGGKGAILWDIHGREYLDGNSSIWTNLHGHCHPLINAAIKEQLERFAHVSFLGTTHPLAAELAKNLTSLIPSGTLQRVFFSDNGSTAIEVALKIAFQYWQQNGFPNRKKFIAFSGAYHGDTAGASSIGDIPLFHDRFSEMHFPVYRVSSADELQTHESLLRGEIAGVVLEPIVQGVNRIFLWPRGMLRQVREICDCFGVFLILDEVLTGFGRTGRMFAFEHEGVVPDILCLAKGLTGGYLPLAATITNQRIYEGFLGEWHEGRSLFYGHSYTANALGCAAALANLKVFEEENTLQKVNELANFLSELLESLSEKCRFTKNFRQVGLIAGIDLNDEDGKPFPPLSRAGWRVCQAARKYGLLTRNIGDTVILIPPYCSTKEQLKKMVSAISRAAEECLMS
ncbi:MAG: adenosylmethionine--8-amino-7-oxononanoate transaminase [Chthoniobacterales bacterium]|nr:adenosylmethionine--8-amino-7-oxononanoate transaminase [Chthoniobacterales bacterium]